MKHELYFDRGIRQYFSPKEGGVGRRILFGELQGFQETEQESVVANGGATKENWLLIWGMITILQRKHKLMMDRKLLSH